MVTSRQRVRCDCGKEYTVLDDPAQRSSIRCHMCGRVIDLSFLKAAAAETEAVARTLARKARIEQAQRANYTGLRFDGVYRTSSPVAIDSAFADAMELSFRFSSERTVNYAFRAIADDHGVPSEVDQHSGQTAYEVAGEEAIRFSFDTGVWVCEWEGSVRGDMLVLTYRIEEYFGISCGPKCVCEGEAALVFVQSPNSA